MIDCIKIDFGYRSCTVTQTNKKSPTAGNGAEKVKTLSIRPTLSLMPPELQRESSVLQFPSFVDVGNNPSSHGSVEKGHKFVGGFLTQFQDVFCRISFLIAMLDGVSFFCPAWHGVSLKIVIMCPCHLRPLSILLVMEATILESDRSKTKCSCFSKSGKTKPADLIDDRSLPSCENVHCHPLSQLHFPETWREVSNPWLPRNALPFGSLGAKKLFACHSKCLFWPQLPAFRSSPPYQNVTHVFFKVYMCLF